MSGLLLFLAIIFIIIGLPIYMVGCDDKIGGYCNGFVKHTAIVIDNTCDLTSGHRSHGKSSDDDAIGFNCNVHIQYIANGKNKTCPIYRSDSDNCSPLVFTWSQVHQCNKLNKKDYPLGKEFTIYVNKVDGRCETHHYVQKYAIIGFVFLIIAGVFIVIPLFIIVKDIILNPLLARKYEPTNSIELQDFTHNVKKRPAIIIDINENIQTV